jgi:hypothetical protein
LISPKTAPKVATHPSNLREINEGLEERDLLEYAHAHARTRAKAMPAACAPLRPASRRYRRQAVKQTLATLDLTEQPHQRVWHIRRVPHCQIDGPVELRPGERPFAAGPHHDAYVCMVDREETEHVR